VRKKIAVIIVTFVVVIPPDYLESKSFVYFSPDDKPTDKLIELISTAKHKIHAAVYMITDQKIAQALVDAKARGVDVQLIVDKSSVDTAYGKGPFLKKNKVSLYVFAGPSRTSPRWFETKPAVSPHHERGDKGARPEEQRSCVSKGRPSKRSKFSALMHNKFALIDDQLWTGSFNWTKNANHKNQENVVVTDHKEIYKPFEDQFKILQRRCQHLPGEKNQEPKVMDSWFSFDTIKVMVVAFLRSVRSFLG